MKPHSILCIFVAVLVFSSCIGSYQAPKTYDVQKERTYAQPYDSIWQHAVDWFALHNTPIKTMDKSSGLIASDYNLKIGTYQSYCDCGVGGSGLVSKRIDSPLGNLNLLVKRVDESHTTVTISTFFKAVLLTVNNYSGEIKESQAIDCNSTGQLEKEILDSFEK
jgi:hypothetical protein